MDNNGLGRVPSEPGSQGFAPQPATPSSPIGADPSRGPSFEQCAQTLAAYILDNKYQPTYASAMQREYGFDQYKIEDRAREIAKAKMARFDDMSHEYGVVAEILEYFDGYKLATWAPIAAIIRRERAASAIEARRAETGTGSVHESAVSEAETPNP